jgi:hypothetical protein
MAKTKYTPKVHLEPSWAPGEEPCSKISLITAFNWYNEERTSKDARKFLVEYLEEKNLLTTLQKKAVPFLSDNWHINTGWTARMLSLGAWIPDESFQSFNSELRDVTSRLDEIVKTRKLDVPVAPEDVVSIQERTLAKAEDFIQDLEIEFDKLWNRKKTDAEFVPYTWMMENGVKPAHAGRIAEYFRARAKSWVSLIEQRKKDEYVKESYPWPQKDMVDAAAIFLSFASDAEKLSSNKKAARKPRKKKPLSFDKMVKGLKFLQEDSENKLTSINPVKIIGAQQLWIYNVKTRKLGVYNATDSVGLLVKGSSLDNYKYSESVAKTLRKPKDVLTKVLSGGKIALRKVMSDINSKASELNGRINKDTVLLRVE